MDFVHISISETNMYHEIDIGNEHGTIMSCEYALSEPMC